MPIAPRGETIRRGQRRSGAIGAAVKTVNILTGEIEEDIVRKCQVPGRVT
jgi:hypothetical protein